MKKLLKLASSFPKKKNYSKKLQAFTDTEFKKLQVCIVGRVENSLIPPADCKIFQFTKEMNTDKHMGKPYPKKLEMKAKSQLHLGLKCSFLLLCL